MNHAPSCASVAFFGGQGTGMNEWITEFAMAFGLGQLPGLPGTMGALPGLLIAWLVLRYSRAVQVAIVVALVILAVPVSHVASERLGGKDNSQIVADEFMIFPVAVMGQSVARQPLVLAGTFAVSRVMDGLKPPPARQLEGAAGAAGIVADDLVANLYVWLLLAGGYALYRRKYDRPQA